MHSAHHLSVHNLSAVLARPRANWTFIPAVSSSEDTSCDIVFEEFLVDDVDNSWNERLYVFLTCDKGCDILRSELKEGM